MTICSKEIKILTRDQMMLGGYIYDDFSWRRDFFERRVSLKEEITSEIKTLLIESQKEMLKLLKHEIRENARDNIDEEMENETRSFHTPTRSFRIKSTQNDPNICRNIVTGVLTDSTNQPKRTKARSQSQQTSKERPVVARTSFATDKNDGNCSAHAKSTNGVTPNLRREVGKI